jgi:hypothetical protein
LFPPPLFFYIYTPRTCDWVAFVFIYNIVYYMFGPSWLAGNSTRVSQHRINMPGQLKRHAMVALAPQLRFFPSDIYTFSLPFLYSISFLFFPGAYCSYSRNIYNIHEVVFSFTTGASCRCTTKSSARFIDQLYLFYAVCCLEHSLSLSRPVIYDRLSVCVLVIKFDLSYD